MANLAVLDYTPLLLDPASGVVFLMSKHVQLS